MNISQNIIESQKQKMFYARDAAANDLMAISIKLEEFLRDRFISDLEKYDLRDANNCIQRAVDRIKPVRSLSDLLGE
ncbi:hypothetical protein [Sphingobium sp.]|uniref:hypothetical protein n=1 Tax=Sphingobium sp. TaxID=1912891 RepID=UPI003BB76CA0